MLNRITSIGAVSALAVGSVIASQMPALADHHIFNYVGFWQTVDPLDGSVTSLSITPGADPEQFQLTFGSEFYTICGSDAYGSGTGTIVEGNLVSEDRMILCEESDDLLSPVTFQPDYLNDIVTMIFDNGARDSLVWHRMDGR